MVGTEDELRDVLLVRVERAKRLARFRVPQSDRLVAAGPGDEPIVTAQCHCQNWFRVAQEPCPQRLPELTRKVLELPTAKVWPRPIQLVECERRVV